MGREPPPGLVLQLREIDPRAELIYAGDGKWILGSIDPNRIRRRKAQAMIGGLLALRYRLGRGSVGIRRRDLAHINYRLWYYELVRQGFRMVQAYNFIGIPTVAIVSDFRKRDWLYRHHFERELARFEEEADQDTELIRNLDKFRDFIEAEHRSVHAHAFRNRVIIPSPMGVKLLSR